MLFYVAFLFFLLHVENMNKMRIPFQVVISSPFILIKAVFSFWIHLHGAIVIQFISDRNNDLLKNIRMLHQPVIIGLAFAMKMGKL